MNPEAESSTSYCTSRNKCALVKMVMKVMVMKVMVMKLMVMMVMMVMMKVMMMMEHKHGCFIV